MNISTQNTDETKKQRGERALAEHERLARLFKEDRLAFERERKKLIDEAINGASTARNRHRMQEFQQNWDRKLKSAGSSHNRLILAQHLFWEQIKRLWGPMQK